MKTVTSFALNLLSFFWISNLVLVELYTKRNSSFSKIGIFYEVWLKFPSKWTPLFISSVI